MRDARFDSLTRLIGKSTSRRDVVRALAGSTLGLATARHDPRAAAASVATASARPCRLGRQRCDGTCVDVATDRNHCGRCGHRCRKGKRCLAGACVPSCASVLTAAGCGRNESGHWICINAEFGGASLSSCDLSHAFFERADLSGVDLSGANLTSAVLFASVTTGADFSRADLRAVTWRAATCPDGRNADNLGGTCCENLNGAVPAAGC